MQEFFGGVNNFRQDMAHHDSYATFDKNCRRFDRGFYLLFIGLLQAENVTN